MALVKSVMALIQCELQCDGTDICTDGLRYSVMAVEQKCDDI